MNARFFCLVPTIELDVPNDKLPADALAGITLEESAVLEHASGFAIPMLEVFVTGTAEEIAETLKPVL